MAIIKPFKGVRPVRELSHLVAALPYDVMDVEEAKTMSAGNPNSFLHISRAEIDLPDSVDPHSEEVYQKGRINLDDFINRGVLKQDAEERYYLYRQQMGEIVQTGIVVCASVDDYQSGVIKKHELTRADKEEDRVNHIDKLDANDEPVFYLSKSSAEIDGILEGVANGDPEYDFTADDGIVHTLWIIKEPHLIERLTQLFADIPKLYVADGHHRSAAAARVRDLRKMSNPQHKGDEEYNYFLTVIFPENQLNIMPYNRVVKDLNKMTKEEFLKKVSENFEISEIDKGATPANRHQFALYLDKKWLLITAKDRIVDESKVVERLDVSILQNNILAPLLGIEDPRRDNRIHFIGGIRGCEELKRVVDSGEYAVAFSLHPTSIKELIELADQDMIMPPKSTWFEPKLRSGLVIHLLR